jgi:hypothetical protein
VSGRPANRVEDQPSAVGRDEGIRAEVARMAEGHRSALPETGRGDDWLSQVMLCTEHDREGGLPGHDQRAYAAGKGYLLYAFEQFCRSLWSRRCGLGRQAARCKDSDDDDSARETSHEVDPLGVSFGVALSSARARLPLPKRRGSPSAEGIRRGAQQDSSVFRGHVV